MIGRGNPRQPGHGHDLAAQNDEDMKKYLDKYVYGVKNHFEYLELIGIERLMRLREAETIKEGYHP